MVFSSIAFLGLFFPLVFLLHAVTPARGRNWVLAWASILFYSWGEPRFVVLMLLSIGINFKLGLSIERGPRKPMLLALGVGIDLLLLGFFKYANFFADNLSALLALGNWPPLTLEPIALPIGISFYTFHAISYLVDVYRGNAAANSRLSQFSLYILFFPQLVAGPIIRYKDIHTQLPSRTITRDDFERGAVRFTLGLAKKVLLANPLGIVADTGFDGPSSALSAGGAWLALLCYTLQIYCDFSGYSDMAIGLARMFGFRFPENFNYPYSATSIQDFWRRWHISLSTWFRDYVYIPLGGNRQGNSRTLLNLWTVFLLTGLWHGASWNFVAWGVIHGWFLMSEHLARGTRLARLRLPAAVRHGYALGVVMLAWVPFRSATLEQSYGFLRALFGLAPSLSAGGTALAPSFTQSAPAPLSLALSATLVLASVTAIGLYPWLLTRLQPGWRALRCAGWDNWVRAALMAGLLIPSLMALALGQYNPFIYFRF